MNPNKGITAIIRFRTQHYNPKKYWKRRAIVTNPNSRVPRIIRLYYLYYIKKCDAFNCASLGTNLGDGAFFSSAPNLPHGLNGIVIHPSTHIGDNCTIHQQVTIASDEQNNGPLIGNNCYIGAGARIIGHIHIGDNVKIGANAVVITDVPDCCTAVGVPARIIKKDN